jgi:hypothetical protein
MSPAWAGPASAIRTAWRPPTLAGASRAATSLGRPRLSPTSSARAQPIATRTLPPIRPRSTRAVHRSDPKMTATYQRYRKDVP